MASSGRGRPRTCGQAGITGSGIVSPNEGTRPKFSEARPIHFRKLKLDINNRPLRN